MTWTRNAVSVAEPSVWNQFVRFGTLRKRKYLTAPTEARPLLDPVERIRDHGDGLAVVLLRAHDGGMKG